MEDIASKTPPETVSLRPPIQPIQWSVAVKNLSIPRRLSFGAFALVLAFSLSGFAQQPPVPSEPPSPSQQQSQPPDSPATPAQQTPAAPEQATPTATPTAPQPDQPISVRTPAPPPPSQPAEITEEELKQRLVGKPLFLRGGYLDNALSFNENGLLVSHSPQGSYTLSAVEIDKVRLTKHKVELEGVRYGLHFLGAVPYEDPSKMTDRVRITPKKKMLRITIDRERVETPKKKKERGESEKKPAVSGPTIASAPAVSGPAISGPAVSGPAISGPAISGPTAPPSSTAAAPAPSAAAGAEANQASAETASTPPEERPADPASQTTTTSPAHAARLLREALDRIFSAGLDEKMISAMPNCWKLYYQAGAAGEALTTGPGVLRQNTVDKKAVLLSKVEPDSNEFAQANGVAGPAFYHAIVGANGKAEEVVVARPIGFGLDENAVAAIRQARFEPAIKDGKPVPVMLDLVVQFRIYSKRTAPTGAAESAAPQPAAPSLPGPYSTPHQ